MLRGGSQGRILLSMAVTHVNKSVSYSLLSKKIIFMNNKSDLALLVLSCDKYSDLWDDFFNLKERFWPDCPYHCYLATDSKEYHREGVETIHFGNIRTWSICATNAIDQIKEPYIALFLEDAFIYKPIDNDIIEEDFRIFLDKEMDFLTLERNRMKKKYTSEDQIAHHIWRIDRHQKYGIDTSAAIWNKVFLRNALKKEDCSAWQYEVNFCKEAESLQGLQGKIFFDDRQPFNISPIEVVQLGQLSTDAIKFFKKKGYLIQSKRERMNWKQMLYFRERNRMEKNPYLWRIIKAICKLFGMNFFS